jgi:hypothetical protein
MSTHAVDEETIMLTDLSGEQQALYDRPIEAELKRLVGPAIVNAATEIAAKYTEVGPAMASAILDAAAAFAVNQSATILPALQEASEATFVDQEKAAKWLGTTFARCVGQHLAADKLLAVDELYTTELKTKPANLKLQVIKWAKMAECLAEAHPLLSVDDPPPQEDEDEVSGSDGSDGSGDEDGSEDEDDDDDDEDNDDGSDDESEEEDAGGRGEVEIDEDELKAEAKELGLVKKRKREEAASNGHAEEE